MNDYDAFKAYGPLITIVSFGGQFDTLKSGCLTHWVAKEMGDRINFLGVRIDSGDMAYPFKRVREQLDEVIQTLKSTLPTI